MIIEQNVDAIKETIRQLQMKIGFLNGFIIVIGGCIFGIGVQVRNMTRIVYREHASWIRLTCDMMIYAAVLQMVATGFCVFTSTWKLRVPIFFSIIITGIVIIEEMCALAITFYLPSQADIFVAEKIYRSWYLWECEELGSCLNAFYNYIYYYMFPQAVLTTIAVMLQCLEIMYLARIVRCVDAKYAIVWRRPRDEDHDADGELNEEAVELESQL